MVCVKVSSLLYSNTSWCATAWLAANEATLNSDLLNLGPKLGWLHAICSTHSCNLTICDMPNCCGNATAAAGDSGESAASESIIYMWFSSAFGSSVDFFSVFAAKALFTLPTKSNTQLQILALPVIHITIPIHIPIQHTYPFNTHTHSTHIPIQYTYPFPSNPLTPMAITTRASNPRPAAAPSQPETLSKFRTKAPSRSKASSRSKANRPKTSRNAPGTKSKSPWDWLLAEAEQEVAFAMASSKIYYDNVSAMFNKKTDLKSLDVNMRRTGWWAKIRRRLFVRRIIVHEIVLPECNIHTASNDLDNHHFNLRKSESWKEEMSLKGDEEQEQETGNRDAENASTGSRTQDISEDSAATREQETTNERSNSLSGVYLVGYSEAELSCWAWSWPTQLFPHSAERGQVSRIPGLLPRVAGAAVGHLGQRRPGVHTGRSRSVQEGSAQGGSETFGYGAFRTGNKGEGNRGGDVEVFKENRVLVRHDRPFNQSDKARRSSPRREGKVSTLPWNSHASDVLK